MNIKNLVEELGYSVKRKASSHGGEYCSACPFCKEGDDRFLIWPNRRSEDGSYKGGIYSCYRGCRKSGDAILFLFLMHGVKYPEAQKILQIESISRSLPFSKKPFNLSASSSPSEAWIEKATAFVEWCHLTLLNNPMALNLAKKRGFTLESIKRFKLGYNPGERREGKHYNEAFQRNRKDWGLPEIRNEEDVVKPLKLGIGLVIPSFSADGRVLKVKIRNTNYERQVAECERKKQKGEMPKWKPQKYYVVEGSKEAFSLYGNTSLSVGLVLESELDGMLVQQEARDLLYCVALGGSTKPIDAATYGLLEKTPYILFLPDFDKAGVTAWQKWQAMVPKVKRVLTPHEKSAGDYFLAGGDLKTWLSECVKEIKRKEAAVV